MRALNKVAHRPAELNGLEKSGGQFNQNLPLPNPNLEFYASVSSHDLQEPLRKIITFSSLLRANNASTISPEDQDYLDTIENAALRLRQLIDDLLQYVQIDLDPHPHQPVNLDDLVRSITTNLKDAIVQQGATIEVDDLPIINADAEQMRKLFFNLIDNAIKFQKPNYPPRIKISKQINKEGLIKIMVEDNGIGFNEKYLDRIFEPFKRLHGKQEYKGDGIGLAICRKIIHRHGGSITARSTLGVGSTFIIILPQKEIANDAARTQTPS